MKNLKGFTLIELMILVAIMGILATILFGDPHKTSTPSTSNGSREADYKCIAGYKFTHGGNQIFSEEKKGVPCSEEY